MTNIKENTLSIQEFYILLKEISKATNNKASFFIEGPSGIGKTAITKKFGKEEEYEVVDIQVTLITKEDLKKILKSKLIDKNKKYLLVLNEINHLEEDIMGYLFQLISDKKLENFNLPEKTIIVATGNSKQDSSVYKRLIGPLENRFYKYKIRPDLESFLEYARKNNFHSSIEAFLIIYPQFLLSYNPGYNEINFPSPRNWEKINEILKSDITKEKINKKILKVIFKGILGERTSNMFTSFLEEVEIMKLSMPEYEKLLKWENPFVLREEIKLALDEAIKEDILNKRSNTIFGKLRRFYFDILIYLRLIDIEKYRNKLKKKQEKILEEENFNKLKLKEKELELKERESKLNK